MSTPESQRGAAAVTAIDLACAIELHAITNEALKDAGADTRFELLPDGPMVHTLAKFRQAAVAEETKALTLQLSASKAPVVEWLHLAPDLAQLLQGWHADGTSWSDWDQSVYNRLLDLQERCENILFDGLTTISTAQLAAQSAKLERLTTDSAAGRATGISEPDRAMCQDYLARGREIDRLAGLLERCKTALETIRKLADSDKHDIAPRVLCISEEAIAALTAQQNPAPFTNPGHGFGGQQEGTP